MTTSANISETISQAFRGAFESHPARHSDPGLALQSARETASALVPAGTTGSFDDESLTFREDTATTTSSNETVVRGRYEYRLSTTAGWLQVRRLYADDEEMLESRGLEAIERGCDTRGEDFRDLAPGNVTRGIAGGREYKRIRSTLEARSAARR